MVKKIFIDNKMIINMIIEWLIFYNFKIINIEDINDNDKIYYCSFHFNNINIIEKKTKKMAFLCSF